MTDARRDIPGKLPGWMIADAKSNPSLNLGLTHEAFVRGKMPDKEKLPNALSGFFRDDR
jgi:hypothetical protein